jgi:hypothetical protein
MTRESKKAKTTKLKQKETTTMKTKLTKIIMSSLTFACALACLVAVIAPGTSAPARAADAQVCSMGMLKGLYLFTFDGYANLGGNHLVPTALMEGKRFNGDGTWIDNFATANIGGTFFDATGAVGTYTVAPDCTGTISAGSLSFNIYVGPDAQKLWFAQTAGGLTAGTATRLPGR